jgi:hypothetical protein
MLPAAILSPEAKTRLQHRKGGDDYSTYPTSSPGPPSNPCEGTRGMVFADVSCACAEYLNTTSAASSATSSATWRTLTSMRLGASLDESRSVRSNDTLADKPVLVGRDRSRTVKWHIMHHAYVTLSL